MTASRMALAPPGFAAHAVKGFVDVHSDLVRQVRGGVARADLAAAGLVRLVVGGGSGHYPAFAGYVGPGLADAAVLGDVFASPSTAQVLEVVSAVTADVGTDAGVLLLYGNYAGDALNFAAAARELAADGVPVHHLAVTDDVASANDPARRRGIAGDVAVFKIAGAAAAEGLDLEGVVDVTARANARTHSIGIAFSGCTLPGWDEPLFSLADGTMGLGIGIHGEPGIADVPVAGHEEIAAMLVDAVLEHGEGTGRVAVVLNGLGSVKSEELFVLWSFVAERLARRGLEVVAPLVGELVTSFDMAGCSLTLLWLDDDLERLWLAPARSTAIHRGAPAVSSGRAVSLDVPGRPASALDVLRPGDAASGARVLAVLEAVADTLVEHEDVLGRLDAVAGDGDHGSGMRRGSGAAVEAARETVALGAGARTTLAFAARAWSAAAGGTSGSLWGTLLGSWADRLVDDVAPTPEQVAAGAVAGVEAVRAAGGAEPGDKTMVDAMLPFAASLTADPSDLGAAARAASEGADATAAMSPRLGRARPLAARSVGHRDAGATSFSLAAAALAAACVPTTTRSTS